MEWMDEPNREELEHAGYKCLILRHPELGHLCGYVGVPREHPCYGKHYNHLPYEDLLIVEVHGGLTFSQASEVGFYRLAICMGMAFVAASQNGTMDMEQEGN